MWCKQWGYFWTLEKSNFSEFPWKLSLYLFHRSSLFIQLPSIIDDFSNFVILWNVYRWTQTLEYRNCTKHRGDADVGLLHSLAEHFCTDVVDWMTGPSPASHCHCHNHIIGQVIARGKECIQFVFESTTAYLRNCLLKEANFREIPKITFFQCPKVAPLFTPHMGMYAMLLYFIQNLRVLTFTT